MRKYLFIATTATLVTIAGYAGPKREVNIPQVPTTTEEVAGGSDEKNATSNNGTQLPENKLRNCGCEGKDKVKK